MSLDRPFSDTENSAIAIFPKLDNPHVKCKGRKTDGTRCQRQAGPNNYCPMHDRAKEAKSNADSEERKKAKAAKAIQEERFSEVVLSIHKTCNAKGWTPRTIHADKEHRKFASIEVSRFNSDSFQSHKSVFEVTIDGGIRVIKHTEESRLRGFEDLYDAIMADLKTLSWVQKEAPKVATSPPVDHAGSLIQILRRFPALVRQLKRRHDGRPPFEIQDEYDVQDLLHALLRVLYDDVRAEEYTPSYAGANSRLDFLLKQTRIVVEAKLSSAKLTDGKIGEQLIIDIKRYQAHPDCSSLVCFVYDPQSHLKNPAGLENDLSRKHDKLDVRVVVIS